MAAAGHARLAVDGTIADGEMTVMVLTGSGVEAGTKIAEMAGGEGPRQAEQDE